MGAIGVDNAAEGDVAAGAVALDPAAVRSASPPVCSSSELTGHTQELLQQSDYHSSIQ